MAHSWQQGCPYTRAPLNTARLRRYDRELVHGHWSAVRRIIDGRPPHSVVLRVASVLPVDGAVLPRPEGRTPAPPSTQKAGHASTLLLTDGWHGISAALDPDLQGLVVKGTIRSGTTLLVCAAALEAVVPPRLSLYYNSTFRSATDTPCGCRAVESLTLVDPAVFVCMTCCSLHACAGSCLA